MAANFYLHAISGISEEALQQMRIDEKHISFPFLTQPGIRYRHKRWPQKDSTADTGNIFHVGELPYYSILKLHLDALDGLIINEHSIKFILEIYSTLNFDISKLQEWLLNNSGNRLFTRID